MPILESDSLISLLKLHNRLRNIKRLTSLDSEDFELLYQPAIDQFIESTQLIPASSSYHHTAPGGLISHTIAVIEYALEERTRHILPELSDVKTSADEKHIWTYAVFAAAILHDAGKLLTQQSLQLNNKTVFCPFKNIKNLSQGLTYRLKFNNYPGSYRLHKQISSTFFGLLIPIEAQTWLSQNLAVFDELTAYIQGNTQYSGSIGKIIQYADSRSVAENLGLSHSKRFLGATPPLSEKIITAIRQIVPLLGINKPGAGIFKKGAMVWFVSKRLAEEVRDWLQKHGESVPNDNNRIFDELEYSGFAQRGDHGVIQWITIEMTGFKQKLSVIGFDVRRIYHSSDLPQDLMGDISISKDAGHLATDAPEPAMKSKSSQARNKTPETDIIDSDTDSDLDEDNTDTGSGLNLLKQLPTVEDVWGEPITPITGTGSTTSAQSSEWGYDAADTSETQDIQTTETGCLSEPNDADPEVNTTESDFEQGHHDTGAGTHKPKAFVPVGDIELPILPEGQSLNSAETGKIFIEWLKLMIKHRRFEINEKDSPVHKIANNLMGIMSPIAFIHFCNDYGIDTAEDNKNSNQVRNSVKKAGYFIPTRNGKRDIFRCNVVGKNFDLYFCLIQEKHLLEYGVLVEINQTLVLKDQPKIV